MPYALESRSEFHRLEKQSSLPLYDFRRELAGLRLAPGDRALDAGCGSGIVTRYLAALEPLATVVGCDLSEDRITLAREACTQTTNASFQTANLTKLPFVTATFNVIVCRYVLQHVNTRKRLDALRELYRCLKPGGSLYLVDGDGFFLNIFPRKGFLDWALTRLEVESPVDLYVGRKLRSLALKAGFEADSCQIEALNFSGEALRQEIEMTKARFENASPLLNSIFGNPAKTTRFKKEFISALEKPETTYFYNKFVLKMRKAKPRVISRR